MDATTRVRVTRVDRRGAAEADDLVVSEEPLEIRVAERPVSVTLRTPGDDFALAAGFLFTESILHTADDVESIRHWGSPNVVRVSLREGVRVDFERLQRSFYSTSSCGVCGKTSIDALRVHAAPVASPLRVDARVLAGIPDALRAAQTAFDVTGGLHGAGLFAADGTLVLAREDVGRHNAVDKVIGSRFLDAGTPLGDDLLAVSGRTSFELVQKAVVAGIPMIVAVGAPSSLAIELAEEMGVTLLGFVRDGRMNVYSRPERVVVSRAS